MEKIQEFIKWFATFNINAFYYLVYFLKHYYSYIFVVLSIVYMFYSEITATSERTIDDKRRVV